VCTSSPTTCEKCFWLMQPCCSMICLFDIGAFLDAPMQKLAKGQKEMDAEELKVKLMHADCFLSCFKIFP